MARMAKVVELPSIAKIDKSKGKISAQLTQALREAVQSGDLQPGDPLPSSRELAQTLGVARGTIIEAYDQLLAEGVFSSQARIGTYVSHALTKKTVLESSQKETISSSIPLTKSALCYAEVLKEFKPLPHAPFAVSVPIARTQPSDIWRKFGNKFRSRGAGAPSGYGEPQGVLALRIAIADYVRRSRSVHCEPEQIVITPGIQQALYICSQILFEAKDEVWIEDPAYRGTTAIFEHAVKNIRTVRIPVDEEGIQVETGIKLSKHARAAFVTPSHQYPLGMPMSLARRTALLAWAKQQNAWIIEDDYDSELRYNGQPFPSLQGMAPHQVIYLGTFSKVLFPSLRLGYAVLPKELVASFCGLRVLIDRHPPAADQHVLAAFIQEGYLERHIRRTRHVYAEVRQYIIGLIEKHIPQELAWLQPGDQGMHMVLWLAHHINDIDVASSAVDAGIAVKAISPTYSKEQQRPGLIVGLGDFEPEQMQQAIKKLSIIIQEHDKPS
ncbi:TPA: PLP-dependent aminotransferase family protein [Acinetobacter nosocomialis]|uniref:Aminotransferase class I/II-fold pyridoxal phosphate-dependent enzyme n=1 Tax=Acinetobacter nosocomialis TaxID=106654 RepID=A0AB37CUY2_ACINO|nr:MULTISPECIES: PLP-dependent aminotransferase family protein [Acinetobacter calcoaceticus/baumannii complex]MDE1666750.1 PLP-dependent aminotransferase family protein [Acinetobacter nosocomialis]MDE9417144.1 PLP-dependent aminotransferase family protein [Acinetobacter nosocomialis]QGA43783.1 aminotransferase class I/II-fold pyridoxal phosphate-dependent enzyme [Acinetobacter nosocomialis]HAI55067.1 PLP-dependent aminotransferase family protein [Acinetobacter nosocomialis]HDH7779984.1 PLP-dep